MRIQSKRLKRFASVGITVSLTFAFADAAERESALPTAAAPPAASSLANGVTLSSHCQPGIVAGVQHVSISGDVSHKFLGYGVNVPMGKAARNISRSVQDVQKLGFVWVRGTLGDGKDDQNSPPTSSSDESAVGGTAPSASADVPAPIKLLIATYQAAGIKFVARITRPPANFFDASSTGRNGRASRRVKLGATAGVAQFYAGYLRSLLKSGVHPDLVELINEPNLAKNGKYRPPEYAALLKAVETALANPPAAINLAGPGTAARVQNDVRFVEAMQAQGALASAKALSLHIYYFRDNTIKTPIPPADDADFQTLVAAARNAHIPLVLTEFGGTNFRTNDIDPNEESVNTAEEMKAALDLIRAGASAALVWNLYPNSDAGAVQRAWALMDANGPTSAYWPFYVLSRRIPVGADVLKTTQSDVPPSFTSLGYAAFRSGRRIYVGLSNPSPSSATTVALDLPAQGQLSVVHMASFLPDRAVEQDTKIKAGRCPLIVTIPSGTGTVLDVDQAQ